jgi:hypothetical protein
VPAFILGHRLARGFDCLFHASSVGLVGHSWLRSGEPLVFADGYTHEHSCHSFAADTTDPEFTVKVQSPNKALQATAAAFCGSEANRSHNAVVAGASAPPAAVPELGRWTT